MFDQLNGKEHKISITLPADENGLTSRKCPDIKCSGIFKVKFGTGLKGENIACHCPYCGFTGDMGDFNTPDQQKYIESGMYRVLFKKNLNIWDIKLKEA